MEPYYSDDFATLFLGDAFLLSDMVDECDAVVTDPPYMLPHKFGVADYKKGKRSMEFSFDSNENGSGLFLVESVISRLSGVARNSIHVFCEPTYYGSIASAVRANGFIVKPWIITKQYPPPPMPGNWWPSAFELAMYGYRSGSWFGDQSAKRKNVYECDAYRHGARSYEKCGHPTQKWLPMVEYVVASIAPPGSLVVDPFCGSGTTLVAAKMIGRRSIGFECNERFCEMAANRLRQNTLFSAEQL